MHLQPLAGSTKVVRQYVLRHAGIGRLHHEHLQDYFEQMIGQLFLRSLSSALWWINGCSAETPASRISHLKARSSQAAIASRYHHFDRATVFRRIH